MTITRREAILGAAAVALGVAVPRVLGYFPVSGHVKGQVGLELVLRRLVPRAEYIVVRTFHCGEHTGIAAKFPEGKSWRRIDFRTDRPIRDFDLATLRDIAQMLNDWADEHIK